MVPTFPHNGIDIQLPLGTEHNGTGRKAQRTDRTTKSAPGEDRINVTGCSSRLGLLFRLVSFHNHFSDRPGIRDFAMAPTRTRQSENVSGTVLPIPASLTRPASTCRPKHLNSLFQKSYGTDDHSVRPQLFILSAMLGDRLKPRQEKTAKSVQLPHSPVRSRDVRGTDGAYRACLGVLPAPGRRRTGLIGLVWVFCLPPGGGGPTMCREGAGAIG